MSEAKDPAIKLFGKTIRLPDISAAMAAPAAGAAEACGIPKAASHPPPNVGPTEGRSSSRSSSSGRNYSNGAVQEQKTKKDGSGVNLVELKEERGAQDLVLENLKDPNATSAVNDSKFPSVDNVNPTEKASKTEEDHSETNKSQEKTPKKPDKILPCPRCNSMDTKFCYYNNYNVNQPRYFCKNCQRYWTAGGTMRNVPVGAGRRKSKNLASHYRHVTATGASQNTRTELPNGIHHHNLKLNSMVLAFGSDTPLCESMASALNIAEKTMQNCSKTGFHMPERCRSVSCEGGDNGDDHSGGSSVTAANSNDEVSKTGLHDLVIPNCQDFTPQMPFFSGAPWPYPLNSAQWNSPIPPPTFSPSAFPMPVYPAYWSCTVPGTWNVPWINLPAPQSLAGVASTSAPNSSTPGKHSRDDNIQKETNSGEDKPQNESNTEKCIWIPKTLRVNDAGEAAKSSIWATLGIKNDKADLKDDEKNHVSKSSTVLQANPAALSRSLNFKEGS